MSPNPKKTKEDSELRNGPEEPETEAPPQKEQPPPQTEEHSPQAESQHSSEAHPKPGPTPKAKAKTENEAKSEAKPLGTGSLADVMKFDLKTRNRRRR
jgi:hypothetical protein